MTNKDYQAKYIESLNRVIDLIDQSIDEELGLDTVAEVSGFSKFHFHRIFSAFMGETLNSYIKRVRIEKAAYLLVSNPKDSITKIALDRGLSGSAGTTGEI